MNSEIKKNIFKGNVQEQEAEKGLQNVRLEFGNELGAVNGADQRPHSHRDRYGNIHHALIDLEDGPTRAIQTKAAMEVPMASFIGARRK